MTKEETLKMGREELLAFVDKAFMDNPVRYRMCTKPMCPTEEWSLEDLCGFKLEYDGDGQFFEAHRTKR